MVTKLNESLFGSFEKNIPVHPLPAELWNLKLFLGMGIPSKSELDINLAPNLYTFFFQGELSRLPYKFPGTF